MNTFTLRVHGLPAPQGSKRHVGGGRLIEASKKVGPWREQIVSEILRTGIEGLALDGNLAARITFYLPRPKTHHGAKGLKPNAPLYPNKPPDLDKTIRSTFDALTQAGVITDDARIVIVHAQKTYADDTPPGAHITVTQLTEKEEWAWEK